MSFLAPILSGIGSIFGDFQQQNNNKAMQAALNQIMQQQQQVNSQIQSGVNGLDQQAGQYTSVLPGLSSNMTSEAGGAGAMAPGAASSYLSDALSPQLLAQLTGINAGGLAQNATSYLSNPAGTNLAQVTPGTSSFYGSEMANGLNPQAQTNAQNQLQQQFQQSQNSVLSQLAPGQNASAIEQANQNNLLSQSTNLAGQLAGQNQQVMAQGAAGLNSNAQNLDAQKQQMLTGAAQLGTNYNQTVLGNQEAGASFGQSLLQQLQQYASQGNQLQEFGLSTLGSMSQQLGQEGEAYTGMAGNAAANAAQNNPFSQFGSILASNPNLFSGGSTGNSLAFSALDPQAMSGYTSPGATATYAMGGAF